MPTIKTKNNHEIFLDQDDFERMGHLSWQLNSVGYARRTIICVTNRCKYKTLLMHRDILGITDPKIIVDHINGNKLDNRKSNLRTCTNAQNQFNRNKKKTSKCNFKGIYLDKRWNFRHRPWAAEIKINGKKKFLGYFATELQAGVAYDNAAKLNHGEFYKNQKGKEKC